MIITFGSAMDLVLSVGAVLLTIVVLIPSVRIFRRWGKCDEEEKHSLEKGFYLAFSGIVIILLIRLFLVPMYFWTMDSFISMIPGAMCLWGVFNAVPAAWGVLPLKLILPALYLGWMLLYYLDGKSKTHPLIENMMAFFIVISPLVLIDSGYDIFIFGEIHPVQVTCCSSATDVSASALAGPLLGPFGQTLMLISLYVMGGVLAASLLMAVKSQRAYFIALALSLPFAGVYFLNTMEVLCPWLLHLPFHRCPFCLIQNYPPAVLFTILMWFGIAAPWLAFMTGKMGHETAETEQNETKLRGTLLKLAGFAVLMALIIIAVCILVSMS